MPVTITVGEGEDLAQAVDRFQQRVAREYGRSWTKRRYRYDEPVPATSVIRCEETATLPLATVSCSLFMSTLVKGGLCRMPEVAGTAGACCSQR